MTETEYRVLFRQTLAELVQKAKQNLPQSHSRIDKAVKRVLDKEVTLNPDGTATVASSTESLKVYKVAEGSCDCRDFAQAPGNFCHHRIAVALLKRGKQLAPEPVIQDDVLDRPLPMPAETAAAPVAAP